MADEVHQDATRLALCVSQHFPDAIVQGLCVEWSSQNPAVAENLVLDCRPEPSLHWFNGYFYDFPLQVWTTDEARLGAIVEFLESFFAERIACGVQLHPDGTIACGGPIWHVEPEPEGAWWGSPGVSIRSWKGSYDSDS